MHDDAIQPGEVYQSLMGNFRYRVESVHADYVRYTVLADPGDALDRSRCQGKIDDFRRRIGRLVSEAQAAK